MKLVTKSLIVLLAWGTTFGSVIAKEASTLSTNITFKQKGNGLVELIYTGKEKELLTIQIFGVKATPLHKERIINEKGFKKPFNFRKMPYGQYTFEVSTKNEKVVHRVNYGAPEHPGNVKVIFDQKEEGIKYMVMGPNPKHLTLKIYDDQDRLIMDQPVSTEANFGKMFSFKNVRSKTVEFVLLDKNQVIHIKKVRL